VLQHFEASRVSGQSVKGNQMKIGIFFVASPRKLKIKKNITDKAVNFITLSNTGSFWCISAEN
jgi:hypothetical protein